MEEVAEQFALIPWETLKIPTKYQMYAKFKFDSDSYHLLLTDLSIIWEQKISANHFTTHMKVKII